MQCGYRQGCPYKGFAILPPWCPHCSLIIEDDGDEYLADILGNNLIKPDDDHKEKAENAENEEEDEFNEESNEE